MDERTATTRRALVLGGARSGKSEVAERLVSQWAGAAAVTYVATARPVEGESVEDPGSLAERVARHRARRPAHWITVEAGLDLAGVVAARSGPVLVDSLGPWVAASYPDLPAIEPLVEVLSRRTDPTVLVSDEVGLAVHPLTATGRWFVDALGAANQALASVCPDVWLVVAGRVLAMPQVPPRQLGTDLGPNR